MNVSPPGRSTGFSVFEIIPLAENLCESPSSKIVFHVIPVLFLNRHSYQIQQVLICHPGPHISISPMITTITAQGHSRAGRLSSCNIHWIFELFLDYLSRRSKHSGMAIISLAAFRSQRHQRSETLVPD